MGRYRRLGDDVEHVVVLRRTSGGARRVVESIDADDLRNGYGHDRDRGEDEPVKVYLVHPDRQGVLRVEQEGRGCRKEQSRALRPLEKRTRKSAIRGIRLISAYLDLHERSNRKKKNGWARDYFRNIGKALRRSRD